MVSQCTYPVHIAQAVTTSYLRQGAFPNVHTANFLYELERSTLEGCKRRIRAHGSGLQTIGLVLSEQDSGFEISLLEQVTQCCPSLHQVYLLVLDSSAQGSSNAEKWVDRGAAFFEMPTVTGLVLSFDRSRDSGEVQSFKSTVPWTRVFPNLQWIRAVQGIDTDRYRHFNRIRRSSYVGVTLMSRRLAKRMALKGRGPV